MATQGVISQELLDPTAVVSIDFGTAYCGIGYAMTASGGSKISIGAPRENIAGKTPTALFLDEHNNLLAFGREAVQAYMTYLEEKNIISGENGNANTATPTATKTCALYQGFKMALYNMKPGTDPIITAEDGVHTIPALKLLAMSLCALKEYAISFILKQITRALKVDEIAWVITVPVIWEERTKLFMRQAATEAGIVQYSMSARLKIALEPEAAAIAIESQLNGVLQQDSKFLVADCGAGTVDVTVWGACVLRVLRCDYVTAISAQDLYDT
ncbi:hypothetical protein SARC_02224 [Sphaeroforma arctica JP610]|uniref:Uncharacterized protein n=1 Tax=Sphaeroforma arctica JP610 TaxID=667725 RepID=A0A0L0GBJ3_9EUKA|nr:hypothetical protein SARC_02224 [Sphaeroforma arctica JP610]KNC85603.1 hypothetical protein SARC_02224 [Sphaeroforma arctica JP610]|eukprot:XP_014159505.1 hypothetical protein SARC_02224 [Sphaeroforma arctica JP610]